MGNKLVDSILYNYRHPATHKVNCDLCDELARCVKTGEPYFAGRFGQTEIYNLRVYEHKLFFKYQKAIDQLGKWSGFFPTDTKYLGKFAKIYIGAMPEVDALYQMGAPGERQLIKKYCKPDVKYINNLGCWAEDNPYTQYLEGKKVLVVHPFVDTIRKQYEIREKLFPKTPDMIPEFELLTLRAVQTIAGQKDERFSNWFEAYDWMRNEIAKVDYDIALIGCGAYGFPLGAYCKRMGKIAIHMGGDLQMQFGIIGGRWDDHEIAKRLVNEYWVRPSQDETPKSSEVVENACYW